MVTSPYDWKILEWDDKPQTNKQSNIGRKVLYRLGRILLILESKVQQFYDILKPITYQPGYIVNGTIFFGSLNNSLIIIWIK